MSMKTDDEYFEFLLKKASDAYCDEQGEKYIKELESSEKAKVSKNFKRRTKKTIIGKI